MFLHPLSMYHSCFNNFADSTAFHWFSLKLWGTGQNAGLRQSYLMNEGHTIHGFWLPQCHSDEFFHIKQTNKQIKNPKTIQWYIPVFQKTVFWKREAVTERKKKPVINWWCFCGRVYVHSTKLMSHLNENPSGSLVNKKPIAQCNADLTACW